MLKIFMSYAVEDQVTVHPYYARLKEKGFDAWMDCEKLIPGVAWEYEIDKALGEAHVVLIFMSKKSVSKRGFVTREANEAVQNLRYKQKGDIYIIPLKIEDCDVPEQISKIAQYGDLQKAGEWDKVIEALSRAADQLEIEIEKGVEHGPFQVFVSSINEEWRGLPGHNIAVEYPRFQSATHKKIADELNAYFLGRAMSVLVSSRTEPWNQSPDIFPQTEPGDFYASNGQWENFAIEYATKNGISISYKVGWYGAGAAHPNSHFDVFNFSFHNDGLIPFSLFDLFSDAEKGFAILSEYCRKDLRRQWFERTEEAPDEDDQKFIDGGTSPEEQNFKNFTLNGAGLNILFSPYQVAPYALGAWAVHVPFYEVRDILKSAPPAPMSNWRVREQ